MKKISFFNHIKTVVSLFIALIISVSHIAIAQEQQRSKKDEPGYEVIGAGITGASEVRWTGGAPESKLILESSDDRLVQGFNRAKKQAMAFVFDGDPVGPWYEAAEPGREAFCMRDVAHQAMGAHALGLARYNFNMLRRFAENIADSRDWCSYWEIDRYNRPAPVDYKNDAEFWYNLPANFDILDCCFRMYLWTGDPAYVRDSVFLNFYDRTVTDYIERWGLGLDQIMKRPRILNARGIFDPQDKFQPNRGLPGYDEQTRGYVLGADVLATLYAAYLAYTYIQETRGRTELASLYQKRAAEVRALVDREWWNEKEQCFFSCVNKDHVLEGRGGNVLLVHQVVDDAAKIKGVLKSGQSGSIEVLYRYGYVDAAYAKLIDMTTPGRSRMDYPEIPYSVIGAIVNGTMGVTLEAPSPQEAWSKGYWVEKVIKTVSGLSKETHWAELRNLPIHTNEITVRHEENRKSVLTNQHGPAFIWQAEFIGSHETLLVNGRPMKAQIDTDSLNRQTSSVRVTVGGGGTISVEVVD